MNDTLLYLEVQRGTITDKERGILRKFQAERHLADNHFGRVQKGYLERESAAAIIEKKIIDNSK